MATSTRNEQGYRTGPVRNVSDEQREGRGGGASAHGATTARDATRSAAGTGMRGYGAPYGGYGSPFTTVRRMMEDMDRLFGNFGPSGSLTPGRAAGNWPSLGNRGWERELTDATWTPALELFEKEGSLVVRADLPGMRREDVNVEVNEGVLTISGERKSEFSEEKEGIYRSERSYGRFSRAIALPEGMTGDEANATFKDGVLEITVPIPKRPETRRRIEIK